MAEARNLVTYELAGLEANRLLLAAEPPPDIPLRPADLAVDLPAMIELCQISFALAREETACAEVMDIARHPGLGPPGVFVALDGGLMVGMVVGRIEMPAPGQGTRRAAVELMVVHPGYRRRGIGRALLGRLLTWLADRGVDRVVASTEDPVVAAILEGHGFQTNRDD